MTKVCNGSEYKTFRSFPSALAKQMSLGSLPVNLETFLMDRSQNVNSFELLLYNILLPIYCYIGSIAINAMTKTMNNIGIPHGYFIRSLGHCISPLYFIRSSRYF